MKLILTVAIFTLISAVFAHADANLSKREVTDITGTHRLNLYYIAAESESGGSRKVTGYNFSSLVWRTRHEGNWTKRAEVTQVDFQKGSDRRRWIIDIHSVDPTTGYAIVKVAEGDAPVGSSIVNFVGSWRQWDLLRNREISVIRICKELNEPY